MSKLLTGAACVLALGLVVSGCATKKCEDLCNWVDDCIIDVDNDECIEECVEDYENSNSCADAIKALTDCVDGRGCGASATACDGEVFDWENECG